MALSFPSIHYPPPSAYRGEDSTDESQCLTINSANHPPPLIQHCYADDSSGGAHGDTKLPHVKGKKPMIVQHTPHIGDQVPLSKNGVPKGLALGRGPLGDHSNDPYPEPERGPLGDHSSCEPERGPARDHSCSNPESNGTRLPTGNDGSRCKADDEGMVPQRDTSESGAIRERTVAPGRSRGETTPTSVRAPRQISA